MDPAGTVSAEIAAPSTENVLFSLSIFRIFLPLAEAIIAPVEEQKSTTIPSARALTLSAVTILSEPTVSMVHSDPEPSP